MDRKIFNQFSTYIVLILLLVTTAIKIHSILIFPDIKDWNYNQIKKINKLGNTFSFAVLADNKNSITTFRNIIDKINKEDIKFSIDVGDLVYDGQKEKFRFFIKQIKDFDNPILTVIGNHEIKERGRINYYKLFGRFYYSFHVGNNYFIMLDDANEKNLDPWQTDWLKGELNKSLNYKHRFIFMHVPLFDPRKTHQPGHSMKNVKFAKKLNRLFDNYGVTMVFASHIHGYYRGFWGKTPYIITGGAGAELVGTDPLHYFYHYIKVNITNNSVNYNVIKINSPDFELIDRLRHDAWIYIDSFFAIHFLDSILVICLFYLISLISIRFIKKNKNRAKL